MNEAAPSHDHAVTRFKLNLETRTVVMSGVVKADLTTRDYSEQWASIVEHLARLGISVEEIPEADDGWLHVELDALKRTGFTRDAEDGRPTGGDPYP